jgi:hypothetical protein
MVIGLSGGSTTTFSRECSFGGLAWVVTATPRAVHHHPMYSAKVPMASLK